ncbi:MAG: hypothetical protein ACP5DZ_11380 [Bacteroidales bacterium]
MVIHFIKKVPKLLDNITPGTSKVLSWEVILTLFSFPTSVLINRLLGAEDRGILASAILIPSLTFGIGSCQWHRLVSGLITSGSITAQEAWQRTLVYVNKLSIIFLPIGLLGCAFYQAVPLEIRGVSILYCSIFPIFFITSCLAAIFTAADRVSSCYSMRAGSNVTYLLIVGILAIFDRVSVSSIVLTYIAIELMSLLIGLLHKPDSLPGSKLINTPTFKPLVYGFVPNLFQAMALRIDVWAFLTFSTLVELGQYKGIAGLVLPVGILSRALIANSTAKLDWKNKYLVKRYLMKVIVIFAASLISINILTLSSGSYIISKILGDSFLGGEWIIPWATSLVIMEYLSQQFYSLLQLSGLHQYYLSMQIIDPIIRIVLVASLGYFLSTLGILLGMIIASLFKSFACIILYEKSNLDRPI